MISRLLLPHCNGSDDDGGTRRAAEVSRWWSVITAGFLVAAMIPAETCSGLPAPTKRSTKKPRKELFTGQVALLTDALRKRGIKTYSKEIANQVVFVANSGELVPIVPDWRGRAFFQDKRLRNRKVELVGYRHSGVPYLQILMVFTFDKQGKRRYTDYWCDICSIPMYEIKPCDCCQGDVRLRFRPQSLPEYLKAEK